MTKQQQQQVDAMSAHNGCGQPQPDYDPQPQPWSTPSTTRAPAAGAYGSVPQSR